MGRRLGATVSPKRKSSIHGEKIPEVIIIDDEEKENEAPRKRKASTSLPADGFHKPKKGSKLAGFARDKTSTSQPPNGCIEPQKGSKFVGSTSEADAQEDFEALVAAGLEDMMETDEDVKDHMVAFLLSCLRENGMLDQSLGLQQVLSEASKYQMPTGNFRRKVLMVMHWPPEDEDGDDSDSDSGSESGGEDDPDPDNDYVIIDGNIILKRDVRLRPKKRSSKSIRETFDLKSLSMRTLKHMFPSCQVEATVVDIYCKRVAIKGPDGRRLTGTAPYDKDPAMIFHHASATSILDTADYDVVMLFGQAVRNLFTEVYGKIDCTMKIGQRQRQVFYFDHPEYTAKYASKLRLEKTRSTLASIEQT